MDMTGQQMLWVPAVEAVQLSMLWTPSHAWSVQQHMRRSGRTWGEERPSFYGGLSTPEAFDVAITELAQALGLEE